MSKLVWRSYGGDSDSGYWDTEYTPEELQAIQKQYWAGLDPNAWIEGPNHVGTGGKILQTVVPLALGAMAGYGALGAAGMLGSQAGSAGGALGGAAPGEALGSIGAGSWGITDPALAALPAGTSWSGAAPAVGAGGSWGITDPALASLPAGQSWAGAVPNFTSAAQLAPYMGAGVPAATTTPTGSGGGTGIKTPSSPSDWFKLAQQGAGVVGAATGGGGSGSGSSGNLLGAGIGGLLGYLDAKSQPDSLTVKEEIDPRLANLWYGADGTSGLAGQASGLLQQQLGQPNAMVEAGKQISSMANTLPDYNSAVSNNKSLWDANPWVTQQQDAITNKVTQNLLQNVMPNIGSQANTVGGYGGSRQGIAQGLAMSNMNTDLAPALSNLASNAWENSQSRALQGANTQLNYGLQNQQQQANLLGTGATMQTNAPWAPFNNLSNLIRSAPGNTSRTEPLFSNPYAGALGGASMGSQVAGGVNWADLFKNIGGLFGGSSSSTGSSYTPPVQNDYWNSSNLYPWLKG